MFFYFSSNKFPKKQYSNEHSALSFVKALFYILAFFVLMYALNTTGLINLHLDELGWIAQLF